MYQLDSFIMKTHKCLNMSALKSSPKQQIIILQLGLPENITVTLQSTSYFIRQSTWKNKSTVSPNHYLRYQVRISVFFIRKSIFLWHAKFIYLCVCVDAAFHKEFRDQEVNSTKWFLKLLHILILFMFLYFYINLEDSFF